MPEVSYSFENPRLGCFISTLEISLEKIKVLKCYYNFLLHSPLTSCSRVNSGAKCYFKGKI